MNPMQNESAPAKLCVPGGALPGEALSSANAMAARPSCMKSCVPRAKNTVRMPSSRIRSFPKIRNQMSDSSANRYHVK